MPDAPSKRRWDAENTVKITIKFQKKTDQDIIDYLEGKNKRDVVCEAIRYYIENHKEENMENKYWYAVERDADDNDWGTGSYNYAEAVEMAKRYGADARIAVIEEGSDPICVREILSKDF